MDIILGRHAFGLDPEQETTAARMCIIAGIWIGCIITALLLG